MGVSKNSGTPKSSIKKIGFSIILTIHFGGIPSSYFWVKLVWMNLNKEVMDSFEGPSFQ